MSNIMRSQDQGDEHGTVLQHVSANVLRLRKERGMSQSGLAAAAGLSRRMIVAIERGAANVSLATVDRLSAALGVTFTRVVRPPLATDNARIEVVGWKGRNSGSQARLLGAAPGQTETELWIWQLAPGESFSSEDISGTWHEMLIVLKGSLSLSWEDHADLITEGDFRIFSSSNSYTFLNAGDEPVSYIRVLVL